MAAGNTSTWFNRKNNEDGIPEHHYLSFRAKFQIDSGLFIPRNWEKLTITELKEEIQIGYWVKDGPKKRELFTQILGQRNTLDFEQGKDFPKWWGVASNEVLEWFNENNDPFPIPENYFRILSEKFRSDASVVLPPNWHEIEFEELDNQLTTESGEIRQPGSGQNPVPRAAVLPATPPLNDTVPKPDEGKSGRGWHLSAWLSIEDGRITLALSKVWLSALIALGLSNAVVDGSGSRPTLGHHNVNVDASGLRPTSGQAEGDPAAPPASVSPRRYNLWRGVSKPFLGTGLCIAGLAMAFLILNRGASITATTVPGPGGGSNVVATMSGQVRGVDVTGKKIVIYSLYCGVWWVQPYATNASLPLDPAGEYGSAIHLGVQYGILLVDASYKPAMRLVELPKQGGSVIKVVRVAPSPGVWRDERCS